MSYLEKSEINIVFTILILTIFFFAISYDYLIQNKEKIKKDWNSKKCSPNVIPFAGFINPETGKSALDSTLSNFTECMNGILKKAVSGALSPLYLANNTVVASFGIIGGALQAIRELLDKMRGSFTNIAADIGSRIASVVASIFPKFLVLSEIFRKLSGIFQVGLYSVNIAFKSMKGFLGMILDAVVAFLVGLGVIIALLWFPFTPWTWPMAIAGTILFAIVAGMLGYVGYWLNYILQLQKRGSPGEPSCFDGDTMIETTAGEKKIKNIRVGDVLKVGGKVTATLKCDANQETMYNYHGVIVSSTHSVFDGKWLYISEHPDSILIEKYDKPFIYCLNTSNKIIEINGHTFSDWDDIEEWADLQISARKYIPFPVKNSNIHTHLDGGFVKDTPIKLYNGKTKAINQINVGEKLSNGETVFGVIEIDSSDLDVQTFNIIGTQISGGPNLQFDYLGKRFTLDMIGKKMNSPILYHLNTDTHTFHVKNIKFYDYNNSVETFL